MAVLECLRGEVLLEQGEREPQESAAVDDEAGLLQLPDDMPAGERIRSDSALLVQDVGGQAGRLSHTCGEVCGRSRCRMDMAGD
ncbi:hypothetical protein AB5J52_38045 [Streptomyces sp. R39]|uniref:Uncharacterized protein n=1 Tax=Streptomyces sp. R39 TaxID=3238631 RepID=A0AB39QYD6_9ACTN